ncbi:hypothetical protein A2Z22_00235 [Candidatus Woesebacteria bacterium RBG_16_34_12]|uniref:Type II secretion system protein GspG C-terminal domain-containing protein n=1 Tax=Candidatus Woesebacteria bacterium RBG_16_34_12 TaxID=1802480 RepID=A0A1F7X8W9_9BACT|nr:MAG: hypothetical protein A2Z22_00235 [Candidatus Woesebacteria bacterium RBG_16_34_12]
MLLILDNKTNLDKNKLVDKFIITKNNKPNGFTLIELLIVMAILGILAVVIFIAIDPGERQAQARDTGRISSVTQIGHALEAYYTTVGSFPDTGTWAQDLLDKGELSSFPSGIVYTAYSVSNCTTYVQPAVDPTYCYDLDATNGVIVFSKSESNSHTQRCSTPEVAYFVFSTADGRGGTICNNGDPSPWASGTMSYVE